MAEESNQRKSIILEFRHAQTNQDRALLYEWVNDPWTRMNSFHSEPILFEEHCRWFDLKMKNPHSVIYICSDAEMKIPLGQIRVEFDHLMGEIDFCVEPKFRGMGYGSTMLKQVPSELKKDGFIFSVLLGRVKHTNVASQKAFIKAGYQPLALKEWIEFKWIDQQAQ